MAVKTPPQMVTFGNSGNSDRGLLSVTALGLITLIGILVSGLIAVTLARIEQQRRSEDIRDVAAATRAAWETLDEGIVDGSIPVRRRQGELPGRWRTGDGINDDCGLARQSEVCWRVLAMTSTLASDTPQESNDGRIRGAHQVLVTIQVGVRCGPSDNPPPETCSRSEVSTNTYAHQGFTSFALQFEESGVAYSYSDPGGGPQVHSENTHAEPAGNTGKRFSGGEERLSTTIFGSQTSLLSAGLGNYQGLQCVAVLDRSSAEQGKVVNRTRRVFDPVLSASEKERLKDLGNAANTVFEMTPSGEAADFNRTTSSCLQTAAPPGTAPAVTPTLPYGLQIAPEEVKPDCSASNFSGEVLAIAENEESGERLMKLGLPIGAAWMDGARWAAKTWEAKRLMKLNDVDAPGWVTTATPDAVLRWFTPDEVSDWESNAANIFPAGWQVNSVAEVDLGAVGVGQTVWSPADVTIVSGWLGAGAVGDPPPLATIAARGHMILKPQLAGGRIGVFGVEAGVEHEDAGLALMAGCDVHLEPLSGSAHVYVRKVAVLAPAGVVRSDHPWKSCGEQNRRGRWAGCDRGEGGSLHVLWLGSIASKGQPIFNFWTALGQSKVGWSATVLLPEGWERVAFPWWTALPESAWRRL